MIGIRVLSALVFLFASLVALASAADRVQVQVLDGSGTVLAKTGSVGKEAVLKLQHNYQPGDRLLISGPRYMRVQLDSALPETMVYARDGKFEFEIPTGRLEVEPASAYAPESFTGASHIVRVRAVSPGELSAYRNLALNPYDQQKQVSHFPHATSNSVFSNWPDFQERNAIDGNVKNAHHGVWPYQSWGPDKRNDLWWKVDFGRLVEVDKVGLLIRADFPHDSYWKSAVLEFSDGSHESISLSDSRQIQTFPFASRQVTWVRISGLVPDDAARWCSFVEVQVWGRDVSKRPLANSN